MRSDFSTPSNSARETPPSECACRISVSASTLNEAMNQLGAVQATNLHIRWRELFGRNAPSRLGPDFLKRALAYRLQELAHGGLGRQAKSRLKAAMTNVARPNHPDGRALRVPLVKPGTRFVREWQGEIHEVQALDTGDFIYRSTPYRSLSIIAAKITGTHQSGPRFFGLRETKEKTGKLEKSNG